LLDLDAAVEAAALAEKSAPLVQSASSDAALRLGQVDVALPDGRVLIKEAGAAISPGARILLTGESGSGKSTLFRVLSGIWPFGRGAVQMPAAARPLFLPQKPYMPVGTLRQALLYPHDGGADDATLRATLEAVRLPGLADRLDETANWAGVLSPGEQQRLAVARALLARPDFLFLDEATAAMDEPNEAHIYELLARSLPDTAIVSIGHRATLKAFHTQFWHVAGGKLAV
jgi:putative ATP-binding cassette transporter